MPRLMWFLWLHRPLTALAGAVALSGCVPAPVRPPQPPPAPTVVSEVAGYLDTMQRLGITDSVQQADLFNGIERSYTEAPTTGNTLRYAAALVMPGHAGSRPEEGRRLLDELLRNPTRLTYDERLFASVLAQEAAARLKLAADARRLAETVDERARAQANSDRRALAQSEENARLKKALEEAQAKLDAIRDIERSIIERSPPPAGAPGPRSDATNEAQGSATGR